MIKPWPDGPLYYGKIPENCRWCNRPMVKGQHDIMRCEVCDLIKPKIKRRPKSK